MLQGLTFVSRRERLYAARKVICEQKGTGPAFFQLNELLKAEKVKETLMSKRRHVKKGEARRAKINRSKKHLFDSTVFLTSRKLACIDDCIKE